MYNDTINKGLEEFKKLNPSRGVNSNFGVIYKDGFKKCDGTICFASAARLPKGGLYFLSLLIHNGVLETEASRTKHHKDLVKFYDLLFNESVWADVFITKSGEEYLTEGYLVARTDVPSNLLIQGLMAARAPTEYSNTIWAFIDLVDAGVDTKLAFAIAACVQGGDYREGTIDFGGSANNHQCIEPSAIYASTLANMYAGKFSELPNYRKNTQYRDGVSISHMWGGEGGDTLPHFIKNNFNPEVILGKKADKAVCLNPFKRVVKVEVDEYRFDYHQAIKAMAIFAKTIEEDFLNA